MNKSAARHCQRLYESLCARFGEEKAAEICGRGVSASASPEQKGQWAAEAMERIASMLPAEELAPVMAGCACGPGQGQLDSARRFWLQAGSLEEYCNKRNEEMKGSAHLEARDGKLYISYPRCYCAMIKNSPVAIPKTWCQCSCEFTRRSCSYAMDGRWK